jgi:hypothetical protein
MDLYEAVKATYLVIGQDLADLGLQTIVQELSTYPESEVMQALMRCRKELRRIALADILDRMPHGHPGSEEAWAIIGPTLNNEQITVVVTEEMLEAIHTASTLACDPIAARVTFKETYACAVHEARAMGKPPQWRPSLGWDKAGREKPLMEAVLDGRLKLEAVEHLLPAPLPEQYLKILNLNMKSLT